MIDGNIAMNSHFENMSEKDMDDMHDHYTGQQPQQLTVKEALEKGNRLIAEFDGIKIGVSQYSWRPGCQEPIKEQHLNYHASWGWLMPVIEKISKIEIERRYDDDLEKWVIWTHHPITFGMLDDFGRPTVRFSASTLFTADTLMEAAWLAVVDFIQWYNTQKQ